MCGVCGAFAYRGRGKLDPVVLRAVRDHMQARGPDGRGEWSDEAGRVWLGHRRLAIIDLTESGAQPMLSADGRIAVTFNGEIYNLSAADAKEYQAGVDAVVATVAAANPKMKEDYEALVATAKKYR